MEWKTVSNACVFNNFNVVDYEWLEQKTYPPRQLNRVKSIKGDVLVTFRKNPEPAHLYICDDQHFTNIVVDFITETIQNGITDTNGIMMAIMEWILRNMIMIGNVDVFMILNKNFKLETMGNGALNKTKNILLLYFDMTNFEKWDKEFRAQNLYAFNNNENALLYLKVRAVCRGKQIKQFIERNNIELKSTKLNDQFAELFSVMEKTSNSMNMLDAYLRDRNNEWYHTMGVDEEKLKSGLRQINNYEWGGDQENSLDQYLVRRFIKVISDFDELKSKADAIATNAWKFVQTSWYNNWTSYLIESIFKNIGVFCQRLVRLKALISLLTIIL